MNDLVHKIKKRVEKIFCDKLVRKKDIIMPQVIESITGCDCCEALMKQISPEAHSIYYYTSPYFKKMHIEITSLCNLKCSHCSRTMGDYPSKNKCMDIQLFKKIIDQVSHRIDFLQLQGFGEPTMHPQFIELLEYAVASKKFDGVSITSNMLFKNPEDFDLYFRIGLTTLIASVDSIDPVTITRIRQGSDLVRLKKTIKAVSSQYGSRMVLQTTVNRMNVPELDDIATFIIECGINSWVLNGEQHIAAKGDSRIEFQKFGNQSLFPKELEKLSEILTTNYGHRINVDTSLLYQHLMTRSRCMMPWEWIHINSEGIAVPCCRYFDDNYTKLGDAKVSTIDEIWCSFAMESFRNEMYDIQPKICQYCIHY